MATENPRVWFKSISLENVRSFGTKQTIYFTNKDGNAARWNVILGDNGTGKVNKGCVRVGKGDREEIWGKGINGGTRRRIRERWDRGEREENLTHK